MTVDQLDRIKKEFGGKGYHIVMRPEGESNVTVGRTTYRR